MSDDSTIISIKNNINLNLRSNEGRAKIIKLCQACQNKKVLQIIEYLLEHESAYLQKISDDLNIPSPMVLNYITKIDEINFINIENKPINKNTKDHRFFSLKKNLKVTIKFSVNFFVIGIASIMTYFATIKEKTIDPHEDIDFSSDVSITNNSQEAIIFSLLVVIAGLVALFIIEKKKKR